jgi:hypothetical protein
MKSPLNNFLANILGLVIFALIIVLVIATGAGLPARAAPAAQFTPFPTPTPGPDGRIIYIVQANDSWWRIAAIFNIDLDQLLTVNNATRDTLLREGQELLLGLGGPSEDFPTPGPTPTESPLLPTTSPQPGSGTLCVLIFDDRNGDSRRQESEPSIPGGAISIADREGLVSITETTTPGLEPQCFDELPEGTYTISVGIPEGYNPTTVLTYTLDLQPGARTILDFGAQANSEVLAQATSPTGSGNSPLVGIFGILLLVAGLGLGLFAGRIRKALKG